MKHNNIGDSKFYLKLELAVIDMDYEISVWWDLVGWVSWAGLIDWLGWLGWLVGWELCGWLVVRCFVYLT